MGSTVPTFTSRFDDVCAVRVKEWDNPNLVLSYMCMFIMQLNTEELERVRKDF